MAETTGAPIVGTTDDEFDSLIEDSSLPERLVPLCLDGKMVGEYMAVKDRIAQRAAERDAARTAAAAAAAAAAATDTRLSMKGPEVPAADERDPEQDRLDELVAKMRAKAIRFVIRAIPGQEYTRLLAAHPPRKGTDGRVDPRDYHGYNSATFPGELVRKCIAQPAMTDDRWAKLNAKLTDVQFDRLFNAAADVNRRDEDIPF